MADENDLINQDEIEQLLQPHSSKENPSQEPPAEPTREEGSSDGMLDQSQLETLLGGSGQEGRQGPAEAPPSAPDPPPPSPETPEVAEMGEAGRLLKQDDIDQLLGQAGSGPLQPESESPAAREKPVESPPGEEGTIAQGDVEYLLHRAEEALKSIDEPSAADTPPSVKAFRFEEFSGEPASKDKATLDLINDVELDLRIELGRTNMYFEDVLKLRKGSVVPLDKLAGDPVDIYVNDRLIARGEVLVLNDNFCVRVGELIAGARPQG